MMCMQCAQHQRTTYNNLFVLVPRACVSHNTNAQHTTICSLSCPAPACHTAPAHNIQQFTRSRVPCLLRATQYQHTTYNNLFVPVPAESPVHNRQQFVRSRAPRLRVAHNIQQFAHSRAPHTPSCRNPGDQKCPWISVQIQGKK